MKIGDAVLLYSGATEEPLIERAGTVTDLPTSCGFRYVEISGKGPYSAHVVFLDTPRNRDLIREYARAKAEWTKLEPNFYALLKASDK